MGIQENDEIEIIADRERDAIILKKKKPTCIFCNSAEHLTAYKGKHICRVCALSISSSND